MTTTTKPAEAPAEKKKAKKIVTKFVAMQRIDRLLNELKPNEKAGVLSWLIADHCQGATLQMPHPPITEEDRFYPTIRGNGDHHHSE